MLRADLAFRGLSGHFGNAKVGFRPGYNSLVYGQFDLDTLSSASAELYLPRGMLASTNPLTGGSANPLDRAVHRDLRHPQHALLQLDATPNRCVNNVAAALGIAVYAHSEVRQVIRLVTIHHLRWLNQPRRPFSKGNHGPCQADACSPEYPRAGCEKARLSLAGGNWWWIWFGFRASARYGQQVSHR